ncbi:MAG: hypothetical protein PHP46_05070 [Candidatus Omnitrophica bacterium]|nr:hypothetical protein [Candidatus Omnitrophota bacterium]
MRLFKYIIFISIITAAALIYVHQQIELVKLSYEIDCKEKVLKQVLDRRAILRYNICNLESPSRLEKVLSSRNIKVSFPKRAQVVRLARAPYVKNTNMLGVSGLGERAGIFRLFDFLGGQAEAHAREK